MKLLTHNMIVCAKRSCSQAGTTAYPLRIKATAVEKTETEFNPEFLKRMLSRLNWGALVQAAGDIEVQIPPAMPANADKDEAFLKNLHTVLLELMVKEGELICPTCSRSYPIKEGVPNLLLNEDEV